MTSKRRRPRTGEAAPVSISVLERTLYSMTEAARLLDVAPSTLPWWLEGRGEGPRTRAYAPVIRERPTGSNTVTWGEFVEAGYLRAYRREHGVPLWRLRAFIEQLRQDFQVPYPLAHFTPFVGEGRRLVLKRQDELNLPVALWAFISVPSGEVMLTGPAEQFLSRVEFATDGPQWAERVRPLGRGTPVVIDPRRSSGIPTIRGVRTEALAELIAAGELADDVAEDFGLPVNLVKAAVAYEWRDIA